MRTASAVGLSRTRAWSFRKPLMCLGGGDGVGDVTLGDEEGLETTERVVKLWG